MPVRFDHLKTFVHQGGGIDSDLRAHVPARVFQCLFHCDEFELIRWKLTKRAAGGCENKTGKSSVYLAPEAWKDGAMLAVDGDQPDTLVLDQPHDELAADDERLLVGERNRLLMLDCRDRRPKPGEAN